MKKIDKNSTLEEILEHPRGEEVLAKHNVPCLSCPFAKLEMDQLTIKNICQIYGIDLEKLLGDINKEK